MAQIEIRKAERRKAKLRLGLAGPSGSGKTMSALKLAKGITPKGKIVLIDTERGSGDLYAHLYDYDIITLKPPYKPSAYREAIEAAEVAGYDVIIIDSLSHAWADEGGLLDQADKLSQGKNRFTVWADLTPQHRSLVNAMLNSDKHIIATVRSKQEYAMDTDDKGRATVKKLGMAPVQREGMEYEFTVFMDIDQNHYAKASKDRTNMFHNEVFMIDEKVGERILAWLNEGVEPPSNIDTVKRVIVRQLGMLGEKVENGEQVRDAIKRLVDMESADNMETLSEITSRLGICIQERKDTIAGPENADRPTLAAKPAPEKKFKPENHNFSDRSAPKVTESSLPPENQ